MRPVAAAGAPFAGYVVRKMPARTLMITIQYAGQASLPLVGRE